MPSREYHEEVWEGLPPGLEPADFDSLRTGDLLRIERSGVITKAASVS